MNYFWAFCVGGAICVAGQLLIDLTGKGFKNWQEMYKVAWTVATRLPNSSQPSSVFG